MTETLDFVDVIEPLLAAGPWTNYRTANPTDPKITVKQKSGPGFSSVRGNKNARVEIKNEDGPSDGDDLAFNGAIISSNLSGQVSLISTKKSDRNLMKTDLMKILLASGFPYTAPRIANNPSRRNKDITTYFFSILDC